MDYCTLSRFGVFENPISDRRSHSVIQFIPRGAPSRVFSHPAPPRTFRFLRSARNDNGAPHGTTTVLRSDDSGASHEMKWCSARNDAPCHSEEAEDPLAIPRRSKNRSCHSDTVKANLVIPKGSKPPLSFRGGRRPTKESSLHPACRPANKPFVISGIRPQMQQIGLVVHSARRRGNDSVHFRRFTGRVCNRTAPRGTFSAFAA